MPAIAFAGNFIFLNIGRLYQEGMSEEELYNVTRKAWRAATRRRGLVQYAAGVQGGIIRSVYCVESWQPCTEPQFARRWEFTQLPPNDDLRQRYVGQSSAPYMPPGARFVVQYNFS